MKNIRSTKKTPRAYRVSRDQCRWEQRYETARFPGKKRIRESFGGFIRGGSISIKSPAVIRRSVSGKLLYPFALFRKFGNPFYAALSIIVRTNAFCAPYCSLNFTIESHTQRAQHRGLSYI